MKHLLHFFILALSIQLVVLCSCNRSRQIIPNPENTDTTGDPDSATIYTKNMSDIIYHFGGTKYDFGPGIDTTYTISFHCGIEVLNNTTVKFKIVDTTYAPINLDTMTYVRLHEPNTIVFTYKADYIPYESTYDTLRYDYINNVVKYYSYGRSHGYGTIIISHVL